MNVRVLLPLSLLVTGACVPGGGGPPTCIGSLTDACRKGVDLAGYLGVEAEDDLADGNAILSEGGILGGGHYSASLRIRAAKQATPIMGGVTIRTDGTSPASDYQVQKRTAMSIAASAGIGIWSGIAAGQTHILGFDLLASVSTMPGYAAPDLQRNGSKMVFGLGYRVGLMQETTKLPGVSVSLTHRSLPAFSVATDAPGSGPDESVHLAVVGLKLTSTSWRLAASKQFGRLGLTGGIGNDDYEGRGLVQVNLHRGQGSITGEEYTGLDVKRTNAYLGASYDIHGIRLAAEAGQVSGAGKYSSFSSNIVNTFGGGSPTRSRSYLSIGVRVGQ